MSGWIYRVDGEIRNIGCSKDTLRDGQTVEFIYTCDLGRDIGNSTVTEGSDMP